MSTSSPSSSSEPIVVTLFETYGAGASYVGPRVAQALGVPYFDQAFSSTAIEAAEEAAQASHADESFIGRLLARIGHSAAVDVDPSIPLFQADDAQRVAENTAFVLSAGRTGGVLLGRNAALLLADQRGALHVRLDGAVADRVARAADEAGISIERATHRCAIEDRVRVEMSQKYYSFDPSAATAYDLVINTSTLSLTAAVDLIVAAYAAKRRA